MKNSRSRNLYFVFSITHSHSHSHFICLSFFLLQNLEKKSTQIPNILILLLTHPSSTQIQSFQFCSYINSFMAALYSTSSCFCGSLGSYPVHKSVKLGHGKVRDSGFYFPHRFQCATPKLHVQAKALSVDGLPEIMDSSLVVCFGEMLIDFVPTISGLSLAEAPAFKKAPGGAPANVAVGIARLGGSSAFIGKVGEDEFGYMLADILKENNVNNEGMRFDPGARTALAFVTLRSDGEREFMFYRNPSADMLLQENELDFDLITKATIFHYGSISLITEPCKSAHIAAAKVAKDAGVVLSYDPNLRLPLWPSAESARKGILSIWDTADIIKVSEEEISFLTQGEDPYDDAVVRKLFHPNLKLLLVTEGADGCRYYTQEFSGKVKGLKVEAVDTTGAGDAFVAGTLSQLASDLSLIQDEDRLRNALKFSNVCGALTVTERGAIPALPTREAVVNALLKTVA